MNGLDLKIGLALNNSLLTWRLLFVMKPLGSFHSMLGASGPSMKELLLHIRAQLWGLAYGVGGAPGFGPQAVTQH